MLGVDHCSIIWVLVWMFLAIELFIVLRTLSALWTVSQISWTCEMMEDLSAVFSIMRNFTQVLGQVKTTVFSMLVTCRQKTNHKEQVGWRLWSGPLKHIILKSGLTTTIQFIVDRYHGIFAEIDSFHVFNISWVYVL